MSIERKKFINNIAVMAQESVKNTGLFASLMIAQACLESNDGVSVLSKVFNNYFGIKASEGWHGKVANMVTTEYVHGHPVKVVQPFRAYKCIEDGFLGRVKFLLSNPRYALHDVFRAVNPEAQAEDFVRAGYATDPKYASLLIQIIDSYNLKKYDK